MNPLQPTEPHDDFACRLTRALETPPPFAIPADFAARVALAAGALPQPSAALVSSTRFATLATRLAFAALVLAMLVLSPWAASRTHSIFPAVFESTLAVEFVLLTIWLSLRNHLSSH